MSIVNNAKIRTAWNKGKKWPQEIKDKISSSKRGKSSWNLGVAWSQEVKDKISQSRKGISAWNKGKKWDRKTVEKISQSVEATFKNGRIIWNKKSKVKNGGDK